MVLWNIIWNFECKINWFVVGLICLNNAKRILLTRSICPNVSNMRTIHCCNFCFYWIMVHKAMEFIWLCWVLLKHVNVEIPNYDCWTGSWHQIFWRWMTNVESSNVGGLKTTMTWIIAKTFFSANLKNRVMWSLNVYKYKIGNIIYYFELIYYRHHVLVFTSKEFFNTRWTNNTMNQHCVSFQKKIWYIL